MLRRKAASNDAMWHPPIAALAGMLAAALLAGCAGGQPPAQVRPDHGDAFLTVTNHHPHHVEVSVRPVNGSPVRLGSVRVQSQRVMRLPRTLSGVPVELVLRCLTTDEAWVTRQIAWQESAEFEMRIEELLSLSVVALGKR